MWGRQHHQRNLNSRIMLPQYVSYKFEVILTLITSDQKAETHTIITITKYTCNTLHNLQCSGIAKHTKCDSPLSHSTMAICILLWQTQRREMPISMRKVHLRQAISQRDGLNHCSCLNNPIVINILNHCSILTFMCNTRMLSWQHPPGL